MILMGQRGETPEEYTKRLYEACNRYFGSLQEIKARIERAQKGYGPIQDLTDCLEIIEERLEQGARR